MVDDARAQVSTTEGIEIPERRISKQNTFDSIWSYVDSYTRKVTEQWHRREDSDTWSVSEDDGTTTNTITFASIKAVTWHIGSSSSPQTVTPATIQTQKIPRNQPNPSSQPTHNQSPQDTQWNCLLLGYGSGIQVWKLGDERSAKELLSLRSGFGQDPVTFIEPLDDFVEPIHAGVDDVDLLGPEGDLLFSSDPPATPKLQPVDTSGIATTTHERLVFAVVTTREHVDKEGSSARTSTLYTLSVTDGALLSITPFDSQLWKIEANRRVIVLGLSDRIELRDPQTLAELFVFRDVAVSPLSGSGCIFSLGQRYIAYATTLEHPDVDFAKSSRAKKITRKVASEMMNGVRTLGGYGYHTVTSYWTSQDGRSNHHGASPPRYSASMPANIPTVIANKAVASEKEEGKQHHGDVVIRDLDAVFAYRQQAFQSPSMTPLNNPTSPSTSSTSTKLQPSHMATTAALFRAHSQPLSAISFNTWGNLIATATTQGHTCNVFELLGKDRDSSNPRAVRLRHAYKLNRGYTQACIQNILFDRMSRKIALATSHGTLHVFRIHGHPTANPETAEECQALYPVARIHSSSTSPPPSPKDTYTILSGATTFPLLNPKVIASFVDSHQLLIASRNLQGMFAFSLSSGKLVLHAFPESTTLSALSPETDRRMLFGRRKQSVPDASMSMPNNLPPISPKSVAASAVHRATGMLQQQYQQLQQFNHSSRVETIAEWELLRSDAWPEHRTKLEPATLEPVPQWVSQVEVVTNHFTHPLPMSHAERQVEEVSRKRLSSASSGNASCTNHPHNRSSAANTSSRSL